MARIRTATALLLAVCGTATVAAPVRAVPHAPSEAGSSGAGSSGAWAGATNGRIAYTDWGDTAQSIDVFTVRRNGQGVRQLTTTGDAFSPDWSPDGRRIVFERNRLDAGTQLWTMDEHGGRKHLLVSHLRGGRFPSWSPDARRIVFAADGAHGTRQLFVYTLRSHGLTRITAPGRRLWSADQPAWSPRGGRIAFIRYHRGQAPELATVRVDGTGVRRLTRTAFTELDPGWSPDGARIAYTRSWQEQPCRSGVYVVPAAGGAPRRVLDRGCDDSSPSWAPDGDRIVLHSNRAPGTPGWRRRSGLWTVRPDGSDARLLLQGAFAGDPAWQAR